MFQALSKDHTGQYQGLFTHHAKFLFITEYDDMVALEEYIEDIDHVSAVVPSPQQQNMTEMLQVVL